MKGICRNCRYWKGPIAFAKRYCPPEEIIGKELGYCCRHAPTPLVAAYEDIKGKTYATLWPETESKDFCGDFVLIDLHPEE